VLLRGFGQAPDTIVSLPGGPGMPSQLLRTLPFRPDFAGQFDADPQSELAVVDDNGVLRFYDATTLLQEPYQPQGAYYGRGSAPFVVADWDADGIDEIAIDSRLGWVGLIDPNGSTTPVQATIPDSGPVEPLAMVDWQGPNSRDLAIWTRQRVRVVDPRSGAVLGTFPTPELTGSDPYLPLSIDWDLDGDGDLAWIQGEVFGSALWLLRNGDGLAVQQYPALDKRVVGHVDTGGQPQLVTVELFGAPTGGDLRLRRRNPQTLGLLDDVQIVFDRFSEDSYALADLHPNVGTELLQAGQERLRLFGMDGTLLWSRPNPQPLQHRYRFAKVPDSSCSGAGCQRILLLDEDQSGSGETRIRLLESAVDGSEVWNTAAATDASLVGTVGLSDLSGDGIPEIFFTESGVSAQRKLVVHDGATGTLRWQSADIEWPVQLQRTDDSAHRVAVLSSTGSVTYVDPADGHVLRQLPVAGSTSPCFVRCDLRYLRQGETVGLWLLGNASSEFPLQTVGRDLRSTAWGGGIGHFPNGIAAVGPNLVNIAAGNALYRFDAAADGVFAEEFEGW
jgi:hypothetical protein